MVIPQVGTCTGIALEHPQDEDTIKLVIRLIERLERLSADSTYAHQASGLRGSLLRWVEHYESGQWEENSTQLDQLVDQGYEILKNAAKELGVSK